MRICSEWSGCVHSRVSQESRTDLIFQLSDSKTVTVQLLGKDDSDIDDPEVQTGRWEAYVHSFASVCVSVILVNAVLTVRQPGETAGLALPVARMPYLQRYVQRSMYGI